MSAGPLQLNQIWVAAAAAAAAAAAVVRSLCRPLVPLGFAVVASCSVFSSVASSLALISVAGTTNHRGECFVGYGNGVHTDTHRHMNEAQTDAHTFSSASCRIASMGSRSANLLTGVTFARFAVASPSSTKVKPKWWLPSSPRMSSVCAACWVLMLLLELLLELVLAPPFCLCSSLSSSLWSSTEPRGQGQPQPKAAGRPVSHNI